ncbi:MAG: hypothetical protein QW838_04115, partial [Candidatus Nitrosotenuis sp.]
TRAEAMDRLSSAVWGWGRWSPKRRLRFARGVVLRMTNEVLPAALRAAGHRGLAANLAEARSIESAAQTTARVFAATLGALLPLSSDARDLTARGAALHAATCGAGFAAQSAIEMLRDDRYAAPHPDIALARAAAVAHCAAWALRSAVSPEAADDLLQRAVTIWIEEAQL